MTIFLFMERENLSFSFLRAVDDQTRSFLKQRGRQKNKGKQKKEEISGGALSVNEITELFHISPKTVYRFRLYFSQRNSGHKVPRQGQRKTATPRGDKFICAVAEEDLIMYCKDVLMQLYSTDISNYSQFLVVNIL